MNEKLELKRAIELAKVRGTPLNIWPGDAVTLQDLPVVSEEYLEQHPIDDVLSVEAGYTGTLAFLEVGLSYGLLFKLGNRKGIAHVGVWK